MSRLNLTLDSATDVQLSLQASQLGTPRAALAGEIIREWRARRESTARQRKLARDYAEARVDAREILDDLELAQLELMGPESDG